MELIHHIELLPPIPEIVEDKRAPMFDGGRADPW